MFYHPARAAVDFFQYIGQPLIVTPRFNMYESRMPLEPVAPPERQSFLDSESQSSHQYEFPLEKPKPQRTPAHRTRLITKTIVLGIGAALAIIVIVLASLHLGDSRTSPSPIDAGTRHPAMHDNSVKYIMKSPCGNTATEARDRGCKFDIISFCWLPEQCYDTQLSQDFDNVHHLEWFMDLNKTQPVSHHDIMTGEHTNLYVNWEYHVNHCTAMWMKMHRAILGDGKKAIDSYIGELSHTKHCGNMLLERESALEEINTIIRVKFPHCGIL